MMFKTVACDYASKRFAVSDAVVSLRVFLVQFNIQFIIDLFNKPKDLSFVIDHRVISLGKLYRYGSGHCIKIATICSKILKQRFQSIKHSDLLLFERMCVISLFIILHLDSQSSYPSEG